MSKQAVATEEITDGTNTGMIENEDLVQKIADRLGVAARSIKVYGKPIESDEMTVIPVSKISYGFGGGAGKEKEHQGGGGGGGLKTSPVGYIEIKDGETRFRPIIDFASLAPLLASGSLFLLTLFWGLRKLIRSTKEK